MDMVHLTVIPAIGEVEVKGLWLEAGCGQEYETLTEKQTKRSGAWLKTTC
jgi:hypothetical protein